MTRIPTAIVFAMLYNAAAFTQTTSTAPKRPVTHRSTTGSTAAAAKQSAPAANAADSPPNVPKVEGTPKPLYALRYVDIVTGTGELSVPRKWYSVRYTGWLTDGTKFDSSDDHPGKEPLPFPYGAHQVITGWDTGFEGMRVGGKRRLYIPYQLAYGETGRTPIPPRADLIFDIELVAMSDTKPAPSAPPTAADPAAQPTDDSRPGAQPTTPTDPTKPTSTSPVPTSNPSTAQPTQSSPK